MNQFIQSNLQTLHFAPLLFACAILIFTAMGWYFGHYRLGRQSKGGVAVRDPLVAAIFGLSALVLGFTFSGASSRYSSQVDLIRTQAQSLQNVYGSLQYLDPQDRPVIQQALNQLLDVRLGAYKEMRGLSDIDSGSIKILAASRKLQEELAVAVANAPSQNKVLVAEILIPQAKALYAAFAAGTINVKSHPSILLMRFLLALLCIGAFLIGYTMAVKNESDWLLASLYTALIGFSLYVILSLELPNILMPYEEINRDFLVLKEAFQQS